MFDLAYTKILQE